MKTLLISALLLLSGCQQHPFKQYERVKATVTIIRDERTGQITHLVIDTEDYRKIYAKGEIIFIE
jgi:hypothetical protein